MIACSQGKHCVGLSFESDNVDCNLGSKPHYRPSCSKECQREMINVTAGFSTTSLVCEARVDAFYRKW